MKQKHIVLYSGGLDSFITLEYVRSEFSDQEVEAIYLPLGHRYEPQERKAIGDTYLETLVMTGLRDLGTHEEEDAYIHHRNAFLCLMVAKRIPAGTVGRIWLTVQKDELSIPDRTPEFMRDMGELLSTLGSTITISSPWLHKDKTDMVDWYLNEYEDGDVEALKRTHSCYRPAIFPCGDCPACIRRYIAMYLNGIEEEYETDPHKSDTAADYFERAMKGEYSHIRNSRTIAALSPTRTIRKLR